MDFGPSKQVNKAPMWLVASALVFTSSLPHLLCGANIVSGSCENTSPRQQTPLPQSLFPSVWRKENTS